MPLYEYQCRACSAVFEELVRASDADQPASCPACGAEGAERLLSPTAALPHEGAATSGSPRCVPRGGFS